MTGAKGPRSARFEVSSVDAWDNDDDYIVLEMKYAQLHQLKKQIEQALAFGAPVDGRSGFHAILFTGRARSQHADRADGTRAYAPSLLSEEVLAESPRPDRWK